MLSEDLTSAWLPFWLAALVQHVDSLVSYVFLVYFSC